MYELVLIVLSIFTHLAFSFVKRAELVRSYRSIPPIAPQQIVDKLAMSRTVRAFNLLGWNPMNTSQCVSANAHSSLLPISAPQLGQKLVRASSKNVTHWHSEHCHQ